MNLRLVGCIIVDVDQFMNLEFWNCCCVLEPVLEKNGFDLFFCVCRIGFLFAWEFVTLIGCD